MFRTNIPDVDELAYMLTGISDSLQTRPPCWPPTSSGRIVYIGALDKLVPGERYLRLAISA